MGRLIGDGMYYIIADVVVHPTYQNKGIGREILQRLIAFVDRETPTGGRSSIQLIAEHPVIDNIRNTVRQLFPSFIIVMHMV